MSFENVTAVIKDPNGYEFTSKDSVITNIDGTADGYQYNTYGFRITVYDYVTAAGEPMQLELTLSSVTDLLPATFSATSNGETAYSVQVNARLDDANGSC